MLWALKKIKVKPSLKALFPHSITGWQEGKIPSKKLT